MAEAVSGTWRDNKRYLWPVALLMPLLPFIAIAGFSTTRVSAFLWIGPIVILGIVPTLDVLFGIDPSNPPREMIEALEEDRYYRWITFLFLPLQYAGLIVAMAYLVRSDLTTVQRIGLAVTVGFIAGLGINTAHELGHKRESVERWIAKVALAQSFYGHFYIEHNRGHHVRVATPADPASSRMGENFYQFWPRTVIGSARSAWQLEVKRLARRQHSPWSLRNDVVTAWLMSVVLFGALVLWLGVGVLPYLTLQAVVGFTLLEAVNYLEHYGLLRKRVGVGEYERYERVEPRHSWNSNNVTTNVLLYHLQRHSDHHTNPTRRYQALQDPAEAPALPTGYAGMILLALVPAMWRRVMDPRVVAHLNGDVSHANLSPRKRQKIIEHYSIFPATMTQTSAGGSVLTLAPRDARAVHCPGCGYVYDVARGDEHEGFPRGTPWSAIPESWVCPDCGVRDKLDFIVSSTVEG